MAKVTIELVGTARILAGQKEISVTVEEDAIWQDIVAALAQAVPGLIGQVITEDRRALISSYQLNLGGMHFIMDLDKQAWLKEGDRISLLEETC